VAWVEFYVRTKWRLHPSSRLVTICRVAQKFGTIILYALTVPNVNRFSKLFNVGITRKFLITLSLKIPPHLNCVATLPCEISGVLRATTENKTTSVTTHFRKLTKGNNVFIVLVIVKSNCHILRFLHQMFNVSILLLDDALKPATPLIAPLALKCIATEVVLFSIVAFKTLYISQGSVPTHLGCGGIWGASRALPAGSGAQPQSETNLGEF